MMDLIKPAFVKLQASVYYEKLNLHLRQKMVEFCSGNIDANLEELKNRFMNNDGFETELDNINLILLPKKLGKPQDDGKNSIENLVINSVNYENYQVERLMIYADMPIELHLIAVLWVMMFGTNIERQLDKYCWGNRLVIDDDTKEIKKGRHLYKPYLHQYQQWWSKAIDEANHLLNNGEDVCILNLDIQNYYHSIRMDFGNKEFEDVKMQSLTEEHSNKQKWFIEKIWKLFVSIHEKYNKKLKEYGFVGTNDEKGFALPVGLLSSPLLANWYLHNFDAEVNNNLSPSYYGRYVDDMLFVIKGNGKPESVEAFVKNKMVGLLEIEDSGIYKISSVSESQSELKLQKEKVFLYYFDHGFSSDLLSKFEKEQKERSSEFRFLSDEEDENFKDELLDFDSCFEEMEDSKARFKPQIENKYKLSCFLAKMIKRRIEKGRNYEKNKEIQLKKFFQGSMLIKHYYFWEKLFTLYVVSNDGESVAKLYQDIEKAINKLGIGRIDEWESMNIKKSNRVFDDLIDYLKYAFWTAMSVTHSEKCNSVVKEKLKIDIESWSSCRMVHFNRYYYESKILGSFYDDKLDLYAIDHKWIPYNIKLSELLYSSVYNCIVKEKADKLHLDYAEFIDYAIRLYESINGWKLDLGRILSIENDNQISVLKFDNGEKNLLTIASVNQLVDDKSLQQSRRGKRSMKSEEVENYTTIIDNLSKIKGVDMFVMPELSMPWELLQSFIRFSTDNQIGFVAGLEYLKRNNTVYNFVITCLPFEIDHHKDCLPVIRLKKAYAPKEKEYSIKESFDIPNGNNEKYHLFKWRGMYFTVFNCFELTNVADRASFVAKVDTLIAIAYNKDLTYYDNIAEATSRDLHCYLILNNVSQYGNSQIVAPKNKENKFLLKTVRGTTRKNIITIETAELDIKGLRLFQRYQQQDAEKSFKPLPFGYYENESVEGERLNV